MTNRRYDDEEVSEIFTLATTDQVRDRRLPVRSGGLTLDELQRIGEEAGIDPDRVAQAVATLDARGKAAPVRRSLGIPVGVSRVVDLPRAPTDREWEQLVTTFRTTFDTPGQTITNGGLREWSQGNLHICVEPTDRGHQLRLSTTSEAAMALNGAGLVTGGMSALMGLVVAAAGKPDKALIILAMFGGMSLAAFGINLFRTPRWARTRAKQMEEIAEHTVKLLSNR